MTIFLEVQVSDQSGTTIQDERRNVTIYLKKDVDLNSDPIKPGIEIWKENFTGQNRPRIINGLFTVELGKLQTLQKEYFTNSNLSFVVQVEGLEGMAAMKIRHVPYAIAANIADEVVKVDASIITGNIRSELVNGYYPNITGLETILTPVQFRKGFSAGINTLHVNPSNRRVGIGTLTPNYTLDVSGIINASSVLINGQPIEIGVQPWYTKTDAISFKYPIGVGLGDAIPQAQLHVGRQALFEDSVSINSILKVNRIDMGDFIIKPGVLQGNWRFSNGSFSELNTISSSKITDGIGTIEAGELKGFIKINSATAKVGQINIQNNRLNNPSGNIELELVQVNNGNISNVTKLTANDIDVLNKLRIGSNPSSEKLVVDGAINIKRATNTPLAGTIQWNGSNFQGYDGSNWIDLDIQTFSAGGWTRNDIAQTVSLINTTDKIGIGTKKRQLLIFTWLKKHCFLLQLALIMLYRLVIRKFLKVVFLVIGILIMVSLRISHH